MPKENNKNAVALLENDAALDQLTGFLDSGFDESLQPEEVTDFTQLIRETPEVFIKDYLGLDFWEKQKEILHSVFTNTKTAVKSCHGSGKTFSAASIALAFMFAFPPAIVIDTAPTGRQVKNQFWREFRRAHSGAKVKLGGKLNTTVLS